MLTDQDNSAVERQLGATIRGLREQKGMTLETLAQRTGMTKGYLSKVERGRKSPPISTLSRIAAALNATIADFFERTEEPSRCTITRRHERKPITRNGALFGYHYEAIAHRHHAKKMEPFVITLVPHAKDRTIFSHPGEEMMMVLEGKMLFFFSDQRHVLNEGDCVYFDSGVPHRGQCLGDGEAKVLVVTSFV
jgi:transcriptional regulator with XRE-family HTH domain